MDWLNIGYGHSRVGNFTAARVAYTNALRDKRDARTLALCANMHRRLWEFEEARQLVDEATTLDPMNAQAWFVSGATWLDMLRLKEAISALDTAILLQSHSPLYRFTRAWAKLTAEQWKEGWDDYRARKEMNPPAKIDLPHWYTSDRDLLVRGEQGLGDQIACHRFIPSLPGLTVQVVPPLQRWFEYLGHKTIHVGEKPRGRSYVYLMDIPYMLGSGMVRPPCPKPLPAYRLPNKGRFNVGLTWRSKGQGAGSLEEQVHGMQKSLPLDMLLPLAAIPGVKLYSLQVGQGSEEVKMAHGLIEPIPIFDIYDTACWMEALDYVISVDTAPLHLAGALGKKGIGLLNTTGGWYYGTGERCAWHPSLKLIRQPKPGDWKGAVEKIIEEVARIA